MLPVANAGAGRTFLASRGQRRPTRMSRARRVRSAAVRYLVKADAQSRPRDVEQFVDVDVFPLRGSLDAASVEAESVEVRDGGFLVLGSHSTWAHLACDEAVQAVNRWMWEQGPERLSRDGHGPQDPFLDFPWKNAIIDW